jgi:ribosome-binding factor A
MRFKRSQRLQELLVKEISLLIQKGLKDPRIGFATVTHIDLTDNLRYAKVFVSIIGNDVEAENTIEGLNNAKGYIRGLLGKNLYLRYIPDLNFQKDESSEKLDKISRLLGKINKGGDS